VKLKLAEVKSREELRNRASFVIRIYTDNLKFAVYVAVSFLVVYLISSVLFYIIVYMTGIISYKYTFGILIVKVSVLGILFHVFVL
jgi:hypothetical protein